MNADLSIGEAQSLLLKAARGVGFSWGLAQEASFAAVWFAHHGVVEFDAFAKLFTAINTTKLPVAPCVSIENSVRVWRTDASSVLCPISAGASLLDFGDPSACLFSALSEPLLLLPFVDRLANNTGKVLRLEWSNRSVTTAGHGCLEWSGVPVGGNELADASLQMVAQRPCVQATALSRVDFSAEAFQHLSTLAHRTYVLATAESRLRGAGDGVYDNN